MKKLETFSQHYAEFTQNDLILEGMIKSLHYQSEKNEENGKICEIKIKNY